MAKRATQEQPDSKGRRLNKEEVRLLVRACDILGRIGERFGVAFMVLIVLLLTIWKMGSQQTQDDFIRELAAPVGN